MADSKKPDEKRPQLGEIVGTVVAGEDSQYLLIGEDINNPGKFTFNYYAEWDMLADTIPQAVNALPLPVRHRIATRILEALLVATQEAIESEKEPPRIVTLDS